MFHVCVGPSEHAECIDLNTDMARMHQLAKTLKEIRGVTPSLADFVHPEQH